MKETRQWHHFEDLFDLVRETAEREKKKKKKKCFCDKYELSLRWLLFSTVALTHLLTRSQL